MSQPQTPQDRMPPPPTSPSPPPSAPHHFPHPLTPSSSTSGICLISGSGVGAASIVSTEAEGDEAVQATNDDASVCKRSAVQLGYWNDPFLQYFMRGPIVRKAPEINRGYFARTFGIYKLILKTLEQIATSDVVYIPKGEGSRSRSNSVCETEVQIINLGCGFDTLYWRLKNDRNIRERWSKIRISSFVDVDFPSTTMRKVHYIKNNKALLATLNNDDGEISISKFELNAFDYHIIGTDLRDINQFGAKLASCGVKFDLPTIFLSECVLVYMDTKSSATLLKWISEHFRTSLFINYEQVDSRLPMSGDELSNKVNMTDRFAEVMLNNLTMRGCRLAGVEYCKDLATQKSRFLEAGWSGVKAWTMNEVYASIPMKEIERVEAIEMLDEHELLKQLFDHYCIVVSHNDATTLSLDTVELIG